MIDHDQLQALISGTWSLTGVDPNDSASSEVILDITDLLTGTISTSQGSTSFTGTYDPDQPTYPLQFLVLFSPDGGGISYDGSVDFSAQPPRMQGDATFVAAPGTVVEEIIWDWSAQKLLHMEVDRGSFSTMDVRPWDKPHMGNAALITFAHPFSAAPGLPLGLTELDIDREADIRINTTTAFVTRESFQINIDSWADTVLYSGGCSWIEIAPEDNDLQWGQFDTQEDHPWDQPQATTTTYITFPRPYAAPPHVVVWLNALAMSNAANWRVNAYATNISQTGFALHINTWADSVLYSAGATWIAYSADNPNIASGTFNTQDIRPWNQPQPNNSNAIGFPHSFATPPWVTVALNSIDIDNANNLRISATASDVTSTGMTWHLDSWADTILYSAGGTYIAQKSARRLIKHPPTELQNL